MPASLAFPRMSSLCCLCCSLLVACDDDDDVITPPPPPVAAPPQANAPDRLPPGELLEGSEDAFGLALPHSMRVDARLSDSVHARGQVSPDLLSKYVKDRVLVSHVEVASKRYVFPLVKIRARNDERLFRVLVLDQGTETELVVTDITPAPTVQGIDDRERWRRAGMTPRGELLDAQALE